MDVVAPKALDASMLLKTSYCHGHCNGCSSSDWLYRWITQARRASLTLLVLSGIIIYCIPQARTPAKKGCHLLIDLVASSLKIIIGRVDETEQIKIVEDSTETSTFSKNDVDSPEQIQDCLKKLESLPLYPLIEYIPKYDVPKDSNRHNVSFSVSEKRRKRHKKQYLPRESDWLEHRKAFCEIHKPRETKFKEKSSEKVSVCPSPLMQFEIFERQKLSGEDSGLSNHKVHERRRKEKLSNVHQNNFELNPQHFSNNDSHSYSNLPYFKNTGSLNQDTFDDILFPESFNTTPRSIGNPASADERIKRFHIGGNPSRPMKTMSWLSDQIHKFRQSLMTLSQNINENIGKLKDINFDELQSPECTTNNSIKLSTIDKDPSNFTNQSSNTTQSILMSGKETRESVKKERSKLSCILDWIFGEAKHSSEANEKKILKIVKQKFL